MAPVCARLSSLPREPPKLQAPEASAQREPPKLQALLVLSDVRQVLRPRNLRGVGEHLAFRQPIPP